MIKTFTNNIHNYTIGGANFIKCIDVESYKFTHINFENTQLECLTAAGETHAASDSRQLYLMIENDGCNALAHFLYETAIYLSAWKDLKREYPSLKVLINEKRDFKLLILTMFEIGAEDIVYEYTSGHNICFFPSIITLYQSHIPDTFKVNLEKWISRCIKPSEKISLLYLPRQSKENFKDNERFYPNSSEVEQFVTDLGGVVFHTDKTTDLIDQFTIVSAADNIILDYGSNLYLNGMFANNCSIYCINDYNQHNRFQMMRYLFDKIESKNTITFIRVDESSTINMEDLMSIKTINNKTSSTH
jgi:hypothetical protein